MGLYEHEGLEKEEIQKRKSSMIELASSINDPDFQQLVAKVMEVYGEKFVECVGSASNHHNYPGGLGDHTLQVTKFALAITECYKDRIDADLVMTGALLHDIGKIFSYESAPNLKSGKRPKKAFKRSEEDRIMGHFGEGIIIVNEINDKYVQMKPQKLRPLLHIIASHHGEARLNWGSLVDPATNEAHIVALSDLLSSRLKLW